MIPLFIGLTAANLLLLSIAFAIGLTAANPDGSAGSTYNYHLALGIAAGLLTTLCHVAIYTYFMATSRWLQAAADKANLDITHFVAPALKRKSKAFGLMMTAVGSVMVAMFLGAAFDSTIRPGSTRGVHFAAVCVAIALNVLVAVAEFQLIRAQGSLMDEALAKVNATPAAPTKHA